ncbi:MAG: cupin domain-containing protein [Chloroflexota bacterium]
MTIRLQFDRIRPGVEVGPHRHGVETILYLAAGELAFVHGDALKRKVQARSGDVLYEAPSELHLVRNEGTIDALALIAATDPDPKRMSTLLRRWSEGTPPLRRRDQARVTDEHGVRRRFLVEPGDFGSVTFTITEIEMQPGAGDAWHRHPGAEHALVVFEGRGVVHVGDVAETLEPLKGIRIVPGRPHRVENTGRMPMRYYVCASPGTDPMIDRQPAEAPGRKLDA